MSGSRLADNLVGLAGVVALVTLVGCADRAIEPPFSPWTTEDVEPREGHWVLDVDRIYADTCDHDALVEDPGGGFELWIDEPGFFVVDSNPDDLVCELEGRDFACPDKAVDPLDGEDYELTLPRTMNVSGYFVNAAMMRATIEVVVRCEGPECAEAQRDEGVTLPCSYAVDFTGRLDD